MSDRLTLGSLFSGSGTFELGGMLAGIKPVWNSEIEPFPIMVTRRRMPRVKHYGDVSALDGAKLEPVDVITFGSPCQDMSVAGRRAGLDGERSGLFHQAIRIIREMREATHGEKPRFIVWENVPGAFSSNGGRDFKAVLDNVIGIKEPGAAVPAPDKGRWPHADLFLGDGWSVAYRVLDAQYWGVPQRRRRIFLVADFSSERAGDILFERPRLSGNPGQGEAPQQEAAGDSSESTGSRGVWCVNPQGSSGITITNDLTDTLMAQDHGHHPAVLAAGFNTGDSASARSTGYADELSPTIRAGAIPATLCLEQLLYNIGSFNSFAWLSGNRHAGVYETDKARTLDNGGSNPTAQQGGLAIVETYAMTMNSFIQAGKEVTPPLMARDYKDPIAVNVPFEYRVRRLMPKECARLQGFPDCWCSDLGIEEPDEAEIRFWFDAFEEHRRLVTHAKKPKTRAQIVRWIRQPHSDSAEYKLWGNGCALPCVYFVMNGIARVNG